MGLYDIPYMYIIYFGYGRVYLYSQFAMMS